MSRDKLKGLLSEDEPKKPIIQRGKGVELSTESEQSDKDTSTLVHKSTSIQEDKSTKNSRVTHHIAPSVARHLDTAWFDLRTKTGRSVSRSEIVEAALGITLAEYDEKGEDSWLWAVINKKRKG